MMISTLIKPVPNGSPNSYADCHALSLCCLLYGFYFTGIKPNSLACWTAINKYFIVVFFE